jgi:TetR/AcrR family macrolide resistance operon transcriptional repressor
MARPFTASDDDILHAARNVISKRGPDAFSIAEVASEVGLSRAAIILRFKSTHALKVASLTHMVQQFAAALEGLPSTPGGDNLLRVAAFIGSYVGSRESSSQFFASYSINVRDKELVALETRRGEFLRQAISRVMPDVAIDRQSAITAFVAHLSGSILNWIAQDNADSRGYLVTRTREWLKLVRIPFNEQVVIELTAPRAASARTAADSSEPQRSKATRAAKRPRPRSKSKAAGR